MEKPKSIGVVRPWRNVLYEEQERERQHTSCLERNETLSFDLAFDLAFYDGAFKRTYPPPIN